MNTIFEDTCGIFNIALIYFIIYFISFIWIFVSIAQIKINEVILIDEGKSNFSGIFRDFQQLKFLKVKILIQPKQLVH